MGGSARGAPVNGQRETSGHGAAVEDISALFAAVLFTQLFSLVLNEDIGGGLFS